MGCRDHDGGDGRVGVAQTAALISADGDVAELEDLGVDAGAEAAVRAVAAEDEEVGRRQHVQEQQPRLHATRQRRRPHPHRRTTLQSQTPAAPATPAVPQTPCPLSTDQVTVNLNASLSCLGLLLRFIE